MSRRSADVVRDHPEVNKNFAMTTTRLMQHHIDIDRIVAANHSEKMRSFKAYAPNVYLLAHP